MKKTLPYERQISKPQDFVVSQGKFNFGTFDSPFKKSNMLDVHHPFHFPIPRWLKWFRVKEWQAFQIGNKDFFLFLVLFDAKLFSLCFLSVYEKEKQKKTTIRKFLPGGILKLKDSLFNSKNSIKLHGFEIEFMNHLQNNNFKISISITNIKEIKFLQSVIQLNHHPRFTKPMVVCMPLNLNRAIYSHKAMMPASGFFNLNGKEYFLTETDSIGILDDHKGYYPFQMKYDWITGFGFDAKNRRIGFNLTDNQVSNQTLYNENCIWVDATMHPLPPIKITRPAGIEKPWIIQDMEGMVDLKFFPEVINSISINAGLFASDYHGPFGSFLGTLITSKGEKIKVDSFFGMGEKQYIRT